MHFKDSNVFLEYSNDMGNMDMNKIKRWGKIKK